MKFLFLGGDQRQKYACDFLLKNNFDANCLLEFELIDNIVKDINAASIIVLPLPVSKDGIYVNMQGTTKVKIIDLIKYINRNQIIFAGKLSEEMKCLLNQNDIKYVDYFDSEPFQISNAILSAEGAIYYAKQKYQGSIYGARIAILGFGRIGKLLLNFLRSQGAQIAVYARKDADVAWSTALGASGFKIDYNAYESALSFWKGEYDIIFNTVPYRIINEESLKSLNKNTLFIDLASSPYCIDEHLADQYSINYHRELGIPGRYAPKAAGEIIGEIIINNIFI